MNKCSGTLLPSQSCGEEESRWWWEGEAQEAPDSGPSPDDVPGTRRAAFRPRSLGPAGLGFSPPSSSEREWLHAGSS